LRFFVVFFFVIYGLLHLYASLKVKAVLSLDFKSALSMALFMTIMIFSPLIVYTSEKHGLESLARVLSYTGYLWMGFLFLFVSMALAIDFYRLIPYAGGIIFRKDLSGMVPSAGLSVLIPALFSLAACTYGYFDAKNYRTEHVTIRTSKLPPDISRLKIVQISDVHLGLIVREDRLKRIIEQVKTAKPDIFVSTGDLVDGLINRLEGLPELLDEVKPRYGKFAITGNHEFYAGIEQSLGFTKSAGFTILRGEGVTVEGIINIAGVDDEAGNYYGLSKNVSEKELLSRFDNGKFTLLLKHRPLPDRDSTGLFDLQLSGHTHKGQIFPFSVITDFYYPAHAGVLNLLNGSLLYVSRGTGTWGPPIRFLSPPEVTVIELVREGA